LGLIILLALNLHLHTPMYFFLFNLSSIDLCYSSVMTPKILMNFILSKNALLLGLYDQGLLFFVISKFCVLTLVAYYHYVSICNPLLYNTAMSPKVCSYLTLASYFMAFSGAMAHTGCILRLTF
jgi:olfactory receptor